MCSNNNCTSCLFIGSDTEFVLCLFKDECWHSWLLYFERYSWPVISGGFEGLCWTRAVSAVQFLTRWHVLEHKNIPTPLSPLTHLSCRNSMGRVKCRPTLPLFLCTDTKFNLDVLIKELLVSDFCGRLLEISAASGLTVTFKTYEFECDQLTFNSIESTTHTLWHVSINLYQSTAVSNSYQ